MRPQRTHARFNSCQPLRKVACGIKQHAANTLFAVVCLRCFLDVGQHGLGYIVADRTGFMGNAGGAKVNQRESVGGLFFCCHDVFKGLGNLPAIVKIHG